MRAPRVQSWLLALALLLAAAASLAKAQIYEVKKGDTLGHIARRHGVTVKAILVKNELQRRDPIVPGQKLEIPAKTWDPDTKKNDPEQAKPWYLRKPPQRTQVQKPSGKRGVNPCLTKDPGFGTYDSWTRAPSVGQMIMPQRGGITSSGRFDVMFHFHGHEAVRKEWVQVMTGAVLVGVDLGTGSGPYNASFSSPAVFKKLVESVEKAMAEKTGKKNARVRRVGLSSWSAGYGAIERILSQSYGKRIVDTVILLDSLHAGYQGDSLNAQPLEPFIEFGRRARRGQTFMFLSHSSIIPPGYASTWETANFLTWKLGGKPRQTRPRGTDPMGLDLVSRYTRGSYHVRGYSGNDTLDHCAHIGLIRDVLKVHIKPRWRSPRGYKRRGAS